MPVFLSQPWLMALIPVGLAIIPLNKLTILLLLVLAADIAVTLLLAEDLRQYRPAYRTGERGSHSIGFAIGRRRPHEPIRWLSTLKSKKSMIRR